ncbi:MAG TPA: hypothetical protein VL977_07335 [Solirubrobacteraceae bacterium]|nr:hypothetical protein [Solirubrobacteraceae bacterium]
MADWSTIASLSTAGGTLVLALATFSSVRASQRSARIAEQALLIGLRPVLAPTRDDDGAMTVMFGDRHLTTVAGGSGAIERDGDRVYLVIPLRNVGQGLAVLHAWRAGPREPGGGERPDLALFRRQTRDLYIPAGGIGFWQGAMRDADDEMRPGIEQAYAAGDPLAVDVLYGDHEGGQRQVSRFVLSPRDDGSWLAGVTRHWRVDDRELLE